ncbi:MAG TPA: Fe-S cluster assembly protein SufD [Saprospiraceae bacterium]|nr:Fe-S cluster assembly protein SufD [Saprospiraceae bacterium]
MTSNIIDIQSEARNRFIALYGTFESSLNGQKKHPFHQMRKMAAQNLEKLSFPTLRDENWKYTSLSRLLQPKYHLPQVADEKLVNVPEFIANNSECILVCVNGEFQPGLSKIENLEKGLTILPTPKALEDERFYPVFQDHFNAVSLHSHDIFSQLALAFSNGGIFIHVEINTRIEKPLHLINIYHTPEEALFTSPVLFTYVSRGASLNMVESHVGNPSANSQWESLHCCLNHLILKENASLGFFKIQELPENQYMVHNGRAEQWRDSVFTAFTLDTGGRMIRNNLSVLHKGQNATSNLYGINIGKGEQHTDNQTLIDHAIPHCQSNEWYKSILNDSARGVFNGKVLVQKDAQKTNAFQQNNTILLSEKARMDSKPQLEIFADDVRCSHGATIGQLDEEAIFYLRSRGLSKDDARNMLQLAFLEEIAGFITQNEVREFLLKRVRHQFKNQ